jgi:hypothetical protein
MIDASVWLGFVLGLCAAFLPPCYGQESSATTPEDGFLSSGRYTNAFFGFTLPIPNEPTFHIAAISSAGSERHLFGLAREKGRTVFDISADQMNSDFATSLMRAAPYISIRGREFSKGLSRQAESGGIAVWKITYMTVLDGYLVQFRIYSFDTSSAENLQHCVEAIEFFDPTRAKVVAGKDGESFRPPLNVASNPKLRAGASQLKGERDEGMEDQLARSFENTRSGAKLPPLTRIRHRNSLEQTVCSIAQNADMSKLRSGNLTAFFRTARPESGSFELTKVGLFNKQDAKKNVLYYPRYAVAVWEVKDSKTGEITYWVGVERYWSALEEFIDYHFTDDVSYHDSWKENVAPVCRGK